MHRFTKLLLLFLANGGVLSGCVLDREGTCGEGDLLCTVYQKEYRFTTEANSYKFLGQCTIRKDDLSSTFDDPFFKFRALGEWDRQTKEFAEAVEIEGGYNDELAITGISSLDPWLNPALPVGITAMAGDPNVIAKNLCVSEIPEEFWLIPFSRNVMVHMLSVADLVALSAQAAHPEAPTPPPAPPCPSSWVTGPPEVDMPKPGLVYKENVKGVTAYLRSRCGSQNVDYAGSFYHVFFERSGNNGWEKFRGYKVKMQYAAAGGSLGSDTLPLDGPGLWRMQARHITQQKHSGIPTVGDFSDWVNFWVGKPQANVAQIDLSQVKKMSAADNRFGNMERRWRAEQARAIPTRGRIPKVSVSQSGELTTLRRRTRFAAAAATGAITNVNAPAVQITALDKINDPVLGGFVDLRVILRNDSMLEVPPGTYALELGCSKVPAMGKCGYRLDSMLIPALGAREAWEHDLMQAIELTGVGRFEITASVTGQNKQPSSKFIVQSIKPTLEKIDKDKMRAPDAGVLKRVIQ